MNKRQTLPKISLEQWAALRAVVEAGSFSKAAEQLNRSQSSVSYMLAKMEERLPAAALTMNGRKAELTPLGEVLYREACKLLDQAHGIDLMAGYLAAGWEPELVIAVDALVSMPRLFTALNHFSQRCSKTRIKLLETTLSGTDEALFERRAHAALTPTVPVGFMADVLWQVHMLPVVGAGHELLRVKHALTEQDLMQYCQIVVRDSGVKREQSAGWLGAEQRWTVSHFASSIEAVKAGLGFAFIPEDKIKHELANGSLHVLPLASASKRQMSIYWVLANQSYVGPAMRVLSDVLLAASN